MKTGAIYLDKSTKKIPGTRRKKMNKKAKQMVKKSLVFLMTAVMLVTGVILSQGKEALAYATPKLIVTGADIKGGSVKAGDEFTMVLHLKNESKSKLNNITLKVSSEESMIITSSGSDTFYIENIEKEAETDVTLDLKTRGNLEQKNYTLNVSYTYEDNSRNTYEETAAVTVPVVQDSRATISEKRLTKSEVTVDGKTSLSFKINNTGKGSIYNVTSEITGETITDISTYTGTIDVGMSGTVDLSINAEKAGTDKINVKVTYEDAEGNVNTVTDSFDFKVTAPEASTITDAAAEAQQGNPGLLIAIIIIVILVIVIIVGAVKRAREKKFE